jgi:hypothetical protein
MPTSPEAATVVLIGGTFQMAVERCREEGLPKPNTPRGPIWMNDRRRLQGLRIDRLITLYPVDPYLESLAEARVARG